MGSSHERSSAGDSRAHRGRAVAELVAKYDPDRPKRIAAAHLKILDSYQEARIWYDQHKAAPAGEVQGLWTAIKALAEAYGNRGRR